MEFIAHINNNEIHSLEKHLTGTASLSANFADSFNNYEWGRLLGVWHDLGKYSDEFQKYIRVNSGYEEGEAQGRTDHSSAGAIFAKEMIPQMWPPLAYCIAGHHAGLLNWIPELGVSGDLANRLKNQQYLDRIRALIPDELKNIGQLNLPCGKPLAPEYMHLWIRILFSCLVDADYLDTERFMRPESFEKRGKYRLIEELKLMFSRHIEAFNNNASDTPLNNFRREILNQCIAKGKEAQGFFSITVPTGGGKTLSAMAWALEHAIIYNKSRIIFAIPYCSIISQTAQVYREIFGDENLIEHHSNIDENITSEEQKLAAENWDAPIIVTTNVQLFESIYANKTSHCRKLHNLVNSIIILDEAQMLPPEFLKPILSALNGLVENFGVSVLFSTATQPVFTGKIGGYGQNVFSGIEKEKIIEIIHDYNQLAIDLKRVTICMPNDLNKASTWAEIADELIEHKQVICIVNTRKNCRELFKLMPEATLHLSRMMCTAHIMDTITLIKEKLKSGEPVQVISTQLIEAGVDIDFPVVYRELAGLDSIAQSAGRCNREGKLNSEGKLGLTSVFKTEKTVPPGLMRKGVDTMKELLHIKKNGNYLSPEIFQRYFELFYAKVNNFDKPDIEHLLWTNAPEMKFQFSTAARNFRLIDDKGAQSIIVLYNESSNLVEWLKRKGPESWLMRKLQRFVVSLNARDFGVIAKAGWIEQIHGCWIQTNAWLYNNKAGLMYADEWIDEIIIA